jgi:hypothetical protein
MWSDGVQAIYLKSLWRIKMKKRLLVVVVALAMVLGIGIGNASAANSLQAGTFGFNVDAFNSNDSFVISAKYLILKDLAVLAGFGFGAKGGDADGTDVGIGGGVRKYLTIEDFAPFVGGTIFYSRTRDGDQKDMSVMGEFGAEYFLHKQFSVEGGVGFGYTSSKTRTTTGAVTTTFKDTTIGTQRVALSFNFYF